ncbi:MAG: metallophosphoesterase family protein [Phycisphaerae bacterium]|nr:metallophosphoesterase family protein [Phycisphaerae bacterium]
MRILILADIDDFHWKHGPGQADMVLSCGDVADAVILEAAEAHGCQAIFAVKGNHDSNAAFPAPIADLHLQTRQHGGLMLGGLNGSWRYKPRGHFLYDQSEVEAFLNAFPPVDLFLSHNSPRGVHDKKDEVHYGFDGLTSYIARAKPRMVIHGHQHVDTETEVHDTRVVGVYGHRMIVV